MSVGIMDADIAKYTQVPFNLEAMKLSAYYKKKREIVVFTDKFTPDRHQDFFYRKDYDDGEFPDGLTNFPNVQYGGLAFSNNRYQPLPMEIESMPPDTSLYEKMRPRLAGTNLGEKIFLNMTECEHCRISLDGKTVWPHFDRQFKQLRTSRNIMFHDYDLGAIDKGFETVKLIMNHARRDGWATKVGMKFPVVVRDGQSLLNWSSLNTNSTFYSLQYDGVIDKEPFEDWVSSCRDRAVFTQVIYHVTLPEYDQDYFVNELIPQLLHQVIIARSYRTFFSLTYDRDYFSDKRWEDVIQLFNYYMTSYSSKPLAAYFMKIQTDTMYDFVRNVMVSPYQWYQGKCFDRYKVREIFSFVRDKNIDLFNEFYDTNVNSLGGKV